ncbi:MAG: hypothetical protein M4579_007520 [Chaenotheca gracillima]|nr:MAG: hypothetical protein M4579_007520 [Chaenotheca gracillima]
MCFLDHYTTRMRCQHLIKSIGDPRQCPEAKARGDEYCPELKDNWSFGSATSQIPCDECIAAAKYVRATNGRWNKVDGN